MSQDVAVVSDEEGVAVSSQLWRRRMKKKKKHMKGVMTFIAFIVKSDVSSFSLNQKQDIEWKLFKHCHDQPPHRPELTMYLGASFITSIRGMSEPTTPSRIPWDSWRDRQKRQNKAPKY